ncbi:hypothetical protein EZV62_026075 [Acer yangbiense]|uniref:CCHC-type domain-containing protein n=1 Tax=Acer yangbiense TaxID=1000413 RepID=A0A5C7GPP6_9ROSI|nr:hypothetical protein EZV62_026075 [Acer yangbiense]
MSTSEIVKLCESLSLSDHGRVLRLREEVRREGIADVSHCLIGKVLSGKKVNREAFINMINQLWSPFGQVEIEVIADNIFMFFFTKSEDRDAVWRRGPWHFDNHLIVLEKPIGAGEISELGFDKVDMWVQIHNLPLMYMNRRAARSLAEEIGQVIEIPADAKECRGKFLRVKVRIDVNKPLKRFIKLAVDDTERVVVAPLIYERLPKFCYACGKLGHVLRECPNDEARIDALEGVSTQFGAWLRVPGPDVGKQKPQKSMGQQSSGSGDGKSISVSDGSTRGNDECRVGINHTQSTAGDASGGSVGRSTSKSGEVHRQIEARKEVSEGKIAQVDVSSLISDTDITNRNLWVAIRGRERDSEGAIAAMEDVVTYSAENTGDKKLSNSEQCAGEMDSEDADKKNVRTWKRVARGSSRFPQLGELDR